MKNKVIDTGLKLLALMKKSGIKHISTESSKYDEAALYFAYATDTRALVKALKESGFKEFRRHKFKAQKVWNSYPAGVEITYTNDHGCCVRITRYNGNNQKTIHANGSKRATTNPLPHYW